MKSEQRHYRDFDEGEAFVDEVSSVTDSDVLSLLMDLRDQVSDHGRRQVTPELENQFMVNCWQLCGLGCARGDVKCITQQCDFLCSPATFRDIQDKQRPQREPEPIFDLDEEPDMLRRIRSEQFTTRSVLSSETQPNLQPVTVPVHGHGGGVLKRQISRPPLGETFTSPQLPTPASSASHYQSQLHTMFPELEHRPSLMIPEVRTNRVNSAFLNESDEEEIKTEQETLLAQSGAFSTINDHFGFESQIQTPLMDEAVASKPSLLTNPQFLVPLSFGMAILCIALVMVVYLFTLPGSEQLQKEESDVERRRRLRNKRIAQASFPVATHHSCEAQNVESEQARQLNNQVYKKL